MSLGNITMRKMKGLHENTVALYMNPTLGIIMAIYMFSIGLTPSVFFREPFGIIDWFLIIFFSCGTVIV
jgi:hypothetical protein